MFEGHFLCLGWVTLRMCESLAWGGYAHVLDGARICAGLVVAVLAWRRAGGCAVCCVWLNFKEELCDRVKHGCVSERTVCTGPAELARTPRLGCTALPERSVFTESSDRLVSTWVLGVCMYLRSCLCPAV